MLRQVYSGDIDASADICPELFGEVNRILTDAQHEGTNRSAERMGRDLSARMDEQTARFSAFKVHRMQGDVARQMLDSDGVLKPFERWKKDVAPLLSHHTDSWLRTEYDTAVLRARQAADWQRFQRHADVLPNLEWMPSTSAHPGADHRQYWGTILPVEHPFWDSHRPGDRWNCKCSLEATDEPCTPVPDADSDPQNRPAPGLDNNPGRDGRLFGDSHPYIANAYPGAREAVSRFMRQRSEQREEQAKETFQVVKTRRGSLRVSSLHGKNERSENVRVATHLANKHGYDIELIANPHNTKSADSFNRTLGIYQEYKVQSTPTRNALDMLIKKGKKQAENIVVSLESGMKLNDVSEVVSDRVRRSENLKSITFVYDGKDATYTRDQMADSSFIIKREDFK
ncbi:MAG: phage minor head protein [Bacteroides sp.]